MRKYRLCTEEILAAERVGESIEMVLHLEELDDVARLMAMVDEAKQ